MVSVRADNGMVHRVPLDCAQNVGLIYNPTNDDTKGLEGQTFNSIADITAVPTLPKVVCATQEHRSSDGKYLVEENEVLIVKQRNRTLFKGKKGLKVFSVLAKTEKALAEDCAGYFSTKPSLVRLPLADIVRYVPKLFPVRAVMYSSADGSSNTEQQGNNYLLLIL